MITKLESFVTLNRQFVDLERKAEEEQNKLLIENTPLSDLCKAGLALKKLKVEYCRTGFGGRYQVKFLITNNHVVKDVKKSSSVVSSHKLFPGDIVNLCLSDNIKLALANGVVAKVAENSITVAFDDFDEEKLQIHSRTFVLVQAVNDVTFQLWSKTLSDLEQHNRFPGSFVVELLFCTAGVTSLGNFTSQTFHDENPESSVCKYFPNNPVANEAVEFCLCENRPFSVIHGPPGTGKTTTLVKIIEILVKRGHRVLACAASNTAVDNLLERLIDCKVKTVRIGHPARAQAHLRQYCLDYLLKRSDQRELIEDIRKEIDKLFTDRKKTRMPYGQLKSERKKLRQELVRREQNALQEILSQVKVICCTLTVAASAQVGQQEGKIEKHSLLTAFLKKFAAFDYVVVDECCQATEIACWAALLLGKRCILAGDHNQLAPTIISEKADKDGFSRTIMQRIEEEFPENVVSSEIFRLLTRQYRMNQMIMKWASKEMYHGKLEADISVANHLLKDLPGVTPDEDTGSPLLLIDTADCDLNEIACTNDASKANIGEATLAYIHVDRLINLGVKENDIAVITPYNLQVHFLRLGINAKYPNVAIRSVDGFQGQEKEAVILSMVRSNKRGDIGFLADKKRINVAVTRARRNIVLICDSNCIGPKDDFLQSLIDHFHECGVVKSAVEFEDAMKQVPFQIDLSLYDIEDTGKKKIGESPRTTDSNLKLNQNAAQNNTKCNIDYEKHASGKSDKNETSKETININIANLNFELFKESTRKRIESFTNDLSIDKMDFETDLNAAQRRCVHELAEEFGLGHFSSGEGSDRRITIAKHVTKSLSTSSIQPAAVKNECIFTEKSHQNKPKPPKNPKPHNRPGRNDITKSEDEEALMEKFAQDAKKCQQTDCAKLVSTLGLKCQFCSKTFCFNHALAEVHGCGQEAQREARKSRLSATPGYLNEQKRKILTANLEKKLNSMKTDRIGKKK